MSQSNMISEYRHSQSSFALEKASTITSEIQIEKARPPAWEPPKLLLVSRVLDVVVSSAGVLLLLGSIVDCSGRSGKTVKEIKAVSIQYTRESYVQLLSLYGGIKWKRGGCIVDCKIANTRIRGNMLGLSKTSIFRRCLAAWGKNQPTVYINIMK